MHEVGGYGNRLEGRTIGLLNLGNRLSDFNNIDLIAERTVRLLDRVATSNPNPDFSADLPDPSKRYAQFHVYNSGKINRFS